MGSHRYRVALAAYRGGCTYEPVKPFFKFEIRSRIREKLLLDVDAVYTLAKQTEKQQNLESKFIAFLDPKKLVEIYNNYTTTLRWLHELQSMNIHVPNPSNSAEAKARRSYTDLIAVYNKLKADGIIVDNLTEDPDPST